jgi:hypothetical protein
MSVTSLNGIQNAVTAVSLNSGISITTAGQELNFNALSGGVTSVIADGQSTAGDITLVGAGSTTITNDGNNTITITSSGSGTGGNWSFRGAWSATNTYAVNDVVCNLTGGGLDFIMYIATTAITTPSADAPWTTAGQTSWGILANEALTSPYNVSGGATASNQATILSVQFLTGAPPPIYPSVGTGLWCVETKDGAGGDSYGDFAAGRFVVAGINGGFSPPSGQTIPFITAVGTDNHLQINGGGATAPAVDIVASGITLNGAPIGGGSGGSITAGGATVACDDPAGTGNITLTTTATGTTSDIILDSTAGAGSGGIAIKSNGDLLLDGTPVGGGIRINTPTTSSIFENTNNLGVAGQIKFVSTDATNPAQLTVGGTPTTTGLYVSNTQLLYNNAPVGGSGVPFPMSNPTNASGGNQWVSGGAYIVGSVVFSPTAPFNWFLCYVAVPTGNATDPQADVSAGSFGQGTYWQLLSPAGFTTTTGTTPGSFYGALTLSGTAITSTNLTTGEVVIDSGSSISQGGGSVSVSATGEVDITPFGTGLATVNGSSITTLAKPGLEIAAGGASVTCSALGDIDILATGTGTISVTTSDTLTIDALSGITIQNGAVAGAGGYSEVLINDTNITIGVEGGNPDDSVVIRIKNVSNVIPYTTLTLTNDLIPPTSATSGWVFTPTNLYLNGVPKFV